MSTPQSDPTAPGYQDEFLKILHNRAKVLDESGESARDKGFVVITRGATSLKRLQHLCQTQTHNHCLTARYRLLPTQSIGTLLAAFLVDLEKLFRGGEEVAGGLIPALEAPAWKELANSFYEAWKELANLSYDNVLNPSPDNIQSFGFTQQPQGNLPVPGLLALLGGFSTESVLRTGQRLVLFGELSEQSQDASEWQAALKTILARLPERVGIVLSGAPSDFRLPERNPHFLEITLSAADVDKPEQSAYRYAPSSFHKDEPASDDKLNVIDYADAIARFVLHEQTVPPLTIGIHGPWGKGKSSFMNLINNVLIKYAVNRQKGGEEKLQKLSDLGVKLVQAEIQAVERGDDKQAADECKQIKDDKEAQWKTIEEAAKKNIVSVSFNAWQFEDAKQTWAGLASKISAEIEKSLPWHSRQWLRLQYAWKERKTEMILQLLLPVAVICLVAGLFGAGFFRNLQSNANDEVSKLLNFFLPAGSILLTIWFVSSQLLKVAEPISARVLSYVRLPNYREQMGFQHRVKDDLEFLYEFLTDRRKNCRVVVYIDDLDRCSEGKIMEILQAINLILASCKFFVFVGMDTEMIYRAIRSHYKDTPTEQTPERYLLKIVQISFFLPPSEREELMAYLYTLFSPKAQLERRAQQQEKDKEKDSDQTVTKASEPSGPPPESSLPYNLAGRLGIISVEQKEAEDTLDELEAFEAYGDFLHDNPREIKRLINIHRLTKILLQKKTASWDGPQQRKLVKWLVFCDRWPDLVDDLLAKVKDSRDSENCLSDLARSLAKPIPELEEFAKRPEVLAARDIDADFAKAAVLSQLVTKSPAPTLAEAEQSAKSVDTATRQQQAVQETSPVQSTSGPVA